MARLLVWAILILVLIRLIWRLVKGMLDGMGYRSPDSQKSLGLVRDPVCGIFVSPANALTSGSGSDTRYFCSEKCRQEYVRRR